MKQAYNFKPVIMILTAGLFLAFCFDISTGTVRNPSFAFLVICAAAVAAVFYKNLPDRPVFPVILTGMLLKLSYVIYTPVWCRQHDVIDFGAGEGHAAYMEYILTHKALPDFDPRTVWAFFQPPLHHITAAVWMWLNIRLGISENRMHKNVQILPLMYMCLTAFIIYMICRKLEMTSRARLVTMLIVSFHPIYILMSGSLNNDALAVMLSVLSIYIAICWYERPAAGTIILLALAIGLSMSAKLSSALIAPGIGLMMIYKAYTDTDRLKDGKKIGRYLLKFALFSVIVFPIGLWWTIRNSMMFGMPVDYIPDVGEHVERSGLVPTLLDVRTASPFLYMKANGYAYDEYNLVLATIKSSLFGEGDFVNISPYLTWTGWILFFAAVFVLVLMLIAFVRMTFLKEIRIASGIRLMLAAVFVVSLAGYVAFAISGMNLSAMNFRYCAAAAAIPAVFLGLWYDRLKALGKISGCRVIMAGSALFALSSCAFYILLGMY